MFVHSERVSMIKWPQLQFEHSLARQIARSKATGDELLTNAVPRLPYSV